MPQTISKLLAQPRRRNIPAARQRANHDLIQWMKIRQHWTGDMTQPACNPMPLHRRTHRFGNNQPDPGPITHTTSTAPPDMNNNVGLHGTCPIPDRRVELR